MDENHYQDRLREEVEARRRAHELLGLDGTATINDVRRAWRRRAVELHPDRHPDDPTATRRFLLVRCAHRLLAEGVPCVELLREEAGASPPSPSRSKYRTDNPWGFFLWWREQFF